MCIYILDMSKDVLRLKFINIAKSKIFRRLSGKTSYLGACTKNTGHVLAVKAPRYDILRSRGEIGRSSTAR